MVFQILQPCSPPCSFPLSSRSGNETQPCSPAPPRFQLWLKRTVRNLEPGNEARSGNETGSCLSSDMWLRSWRGCGSRREGGWGLPLPPSQCTEPGVLDRERRTMDPVSVEHQPKVVSTEEERHLVPQSHVTANCESWRHESLGTRLRTFVWQRRLFQLTFRLKDYHYSFVSGSPIIK